MLFDVDGSNSWAFSGLKQFALLLGSNMIYSTDAVKVVRTARCDSHTVGEGGSPLVSLLSGGADGTAYVSTARKLGLEVPCSTLATEYICAYTSAADMTTPPTLHKELLLAWKLHQAEERLRDMDAELCLSRKRVIDSVCSHLKHCDESSSALKQARQAAEAAEARATAAEEAKQEAMAVGEEAIAVAEALQEENRKLQQQQQQVTTAADGHQAPAPPLPPAYPRITPKPWPGALIRANRAEARVAELQERVVELTGQLQQEQPQAGGGEEEEEQQQEQQPQEEQVDECAQGSVRSAASLDIPEEEVEMADTSGEDDGDDGDGDDDDGQEDLVWASLQAWLDTIQDRFVSRVDDVD
eukprot:gene12119-12258_t